MQSCLCINLILLFRRMFYRHIFDIMMKYICSILYGSLFRNRHLLIASYYQKHCFDYFREIIFGN